MVTKQDLERMFGFLEDDTKKLVKAFENIEDYLYEKTGGRYKDSKIGKDVEYIDRMLSYWEFHSKKYCDMIEKEEKGLKGCSCRAPARKSTTRKTTKRTTRRA